MVFVYELSRPLFCQSEDQIETFKKTRMLEEQFVEVINLKERESLETLFQPKRLYKFIRGL